MDFSKIVEVFRALETTGARYALVGGVAVNLHGLSRATQDVDLFVETDDANIERVKSALKSVFADPSIAEISAEDLAGPYPTIRYVPPDESFVIDLIGRLGTAFTFEDIECADVDIEGVRVHVATPRTLFRMKKDTLRAVDRMDAEALRRKFHLTEE